MVMMAIGATTGISRRRFGKLALSGFVAAAIPVPVSGKLDIGIGTYSYRNLSLEAIIAQLNSMRISEIELSRGEFMLMNHPGDNLFRAPRSQLDVAGIRCVSYYSATIQSDEDLENALRFVKILGGAEYHW